MSLKRWLRHPFLLALAGSFLMHSVSVWRMSAWGREERKNREIVKPLTLRMVQSDRSETPKQIVDIKQSKTEPPKQSAIFAAEDHAAVREQRTKNRPVNAAESNGSGFSRPSPGSLVGRKKNESRSNGGRSPRLVVDPGGGFGLSVRPKPPTRLCFANRLRPRGGAVACDRSISTSVLRKATGSI